MLGGKKIGTVIVAFTVNGTMYGEGATGRNRNKESWIRKKE